MQIGDYLIYVVIPFFLTNHFCSAIVTPDPACWPQGSKFLRKQNVELRNHYH